MEALFEELGNWLNANEGVLAAIGVLLAVLTIAAPRLRAVFRKGDPSGTPTIYDPDTMALHPAFLAALSDAQAQNLAGKPGAVSVPDSFFAPRSSRRMVAKRRRHGRVETVADNVPSIAVFSLDSLTGGEFIQASAAAFTDEIVTGLSSMAGYSVVAGRLTAGYEHQVNKLGVRYLVEGSVRQVASVVRLIVRLVDVETGRHLWAERYECASDELEQQEDMLVNQIVAGLTSALQQSEADRAAEADPKRLDAWSLTMLAFSGIVAGGTGSEGAEKAVEFARRAVKQDPESGYAHSVLAASLVQLASFEGPKKNDVSQDEVRETARRALELSPRDATVLALIGFVFTNTGALDEAVSLLEQSVSLNPYNARGLASLGRALRNTGRPLDAIPKLERALSIAPNDNMAFLWASWLASSYLLSGQLTEAVEASRRAVDMNRNYFWPWLVMTAALVALDRMTEAADAYAEFELYRGTLDKRGIEELVHESLGTRIDTSMLVNGVQKAQAHAQAMLAGSAAQ